MLGPWLDKLINQHKQLCREPLAGQHRVVYHGAIVLIAILVPV
jgi:hypothetical protein